MIQLGIASCQAKLTYQIWDVYRVVIVRLNSTVFMVKRNIVVFIIFSSRFCFNAVLIQIVEFGENLARWSTGINISWFSIYYK